MNAERAFDACVRFGFLLFAVSLPVSHVPAQFAIGIAFFGWIGKGVVGGKWNVRWHPVFLPLTFYLVWNIIASGFSERPGHSLGALVDNEWPLLMMLMLYWNVEDEQTLQKTLTVFLASASVAVIYGLWQTVGGVELYRNAPLDPMGWGFYRAVGFYGFYLTFAAFAMTVFFFSMSFSFEVRKWWYVVLSVLSFLAVVGTFARSMWLSFAAAIPVYAFTRSRKIGLLVSGLLLIVIVGGILTTPALRYRVASIVDAGQNETRLNLWKTAVNISAHHPLLGIGQDNWDLFFERYRIEGFYDTTVHPHNDYLTVLVSSGIPGITAFLVLWGIALYHGFRTASRTTKSLLKAVAWGAVFSLMGLLVGALFQNYYGTFINCLGWWFVVGLLLTAEKLSATTNVGPSPKNEDHE